MIDVLRAEWLKVRTTRSLFWTFVGAVVLVTLVAVVQLAFRSDADMMQRDTQLGIFGAAGAGSFFPLVLGVLLVTNEFWHKTITHTFLTTPRRAVVVGAKFIVSAAGGLAYAIASSVLALVIGLVWLALEGIPLEATAADVFRVFAAIALGAVFFAILGAGIGAIVRNQVAALVGSLVWFLLVENTVVGFFPGVGKYTPSGTSTSVGIALQDVEDTGDLMLGLLDPTTAALLMLAYVVAFVAAGTALVVRRDVS